MYERAIETERHRNRAEETDTEAQKHTQKKKFEFAQFFLVQAYFVVKQNLRISDSVAADMPPLFYCLHMTDRQRRTAANTQTQPNKQVDRQTGRHAHIQMSSIHLCMYVCSFLYFLSVCLSHPHIHAVSIPYMHTSRSTDRHVYIHTDIHYIQMHT